jgi:hypothetical protein
MRMFLAPLAFALAFAHPQEPKGQEPPPRRAPGFETEADRSARVREGILGAWQITRAEIPNLGVTSGGVAGYAIFIEGYMSLEVHVLGNTDPNSANTFFQTGTHRWKLEDNGVMETFGLIGTNNITEDEEYDFEQPGQRREYRARIDGEQLVLEKADRTARFTLKRLGKLRYPDGSEGGTDFYGRPIKKDEGEKPAKKQDG